MDKVGKAGTLYPIADGEPIPAEIGPRSNVRARYTGEFRPPLKGEWFLSGAIVEAYRAPNNLTRSYHIAKLVRGRLVFDEEV